MKKKAYLFFEINFFSNCNKKRRIKIYLWVIFWCWFPVYTFWSIDAFFRMKYHCSLLNCPLLSSADSRIRSTCPFRTGKLYSPPSRDNHTIINSIIIHSWYKLRRQRCTSCITKWHDATIDFLIRFFFFFFWWIYTCVQIKYKNKFFIQLRFKDVCISLLKNALFKLSWISIKFLRTRESWEFNLTELILK